MKSLRRRHASSHPPPRRARGWMLARGRFPARPAFNQVMAPPAGGTMLILAVQKHVWCSTVRDDQETARLMSAARGPLFCPEPAAAADCRRGAVGSWPTGRSCSARRTGPPSLTPRSRLCRSGWRWPTQLLATRRRRVGRVTSASGSTAAKRKGGLRSSADACARQSFRKILSR